jgi:hypothetical protein
VPTSGRRLAFARWLTSRRNPLLTTRPRQPRLAAPFRPRIGGNARRLRHAGRKTLPPGAARLAAATFSRPPPRINQPRLRSGMESEASPPPDRHLHRLPPVLGHRRPSRTKDPTTAGTDGVPVQRLDAESLRDSYAGTSGVLCRTRCSEPRCRCARTSSADRGRHRPQARRQQDAGGCPSGEDEFRRSVYVESPTQQAVGLPQHLRRPGDGGELRTPPVSTVAPQSLMLMNSEFALQQARRFSAAIAPGGGCRSPEQRIAAAWRTRLQSLPSRNRTPPAPRRFSPAEAGDGQAPTASEPDAGSSRSSHRARFLTCPKTAPGPTSARRLLELERVPLYRLTKATPPHDPDPPKTIKPL